MCGRFTQTQSSQAIGQLFNLTEVPVLSPRYNIAPTQAVTAVIKISESSDRQIKQLRWGLIPSWAKEIQIGSKLINARSETVAEKPAFRSAFKHRRCLILADGFYEWQRQNGKKQPFYFQMQTGEPFAFAGLWETWNGTDEPITSCTILTTEANERVQPVHDRMPVILPPDAYNLWLDPSVQVAEPLQPLLKPYAASAMQSYPVSSRVNSPTQDSPDCIQPQAR